MGINSKIDWTDHTWNPWIGCRKISKGCVNCYMFRSATRFKKDPNIVRRLSEKNFMTPKRLNFKDPGSRVFVCSWSDFFITDMHMHHKEAIEMMRDCEDLHFQILTKRPKNIETVFIDTSTPENVSIGVTIEHFSYYERLKYLKDIKPKSRFVSVEPLLSPIDVKKMVEVGGFKPDLIIVGGESGNGFRPSSIEWYKKIINDCRSLRIPVFVKQVSGRTTIDTHNIPDIIKVQELPESWIRKESLWR